MSIRIYALAKDLDIESKALVEICQKLGMNVRGSALASLTDEEIERVKTHLAQMKKPAPSFSSTPDVNNAPVTTVHPMDYGKVPDLSVRMKPRAATPESTSAPSVAKASPESSTEPISVEKAAEKTAESASVNAEKSNAADASAKSESTKPESVKSESVQSESGQSQPQAVLSGQDKDAAAKTTESEVGEAKSESVPKSEILAESAQNPANPVSPVSQPSPASATPSEDKASVSETSGESAVAPPSSEPAPTHSKQSIVINVIKKAEDRKPIAPAEPVINKTSQAEEKTASKAEQKPQTPSSVQSEAKSGVKPQSGAKTEPVSSKQPAATAGQTGQANQTGQAASVQSPAAATQSTPAAPIRKRSIPVINVIGHREERKKSEQQRPQNGKDDRNKRDRNLSPLGRRLAPMPEVKNIPPKKEKEPAAQKPDITLSIDVIRGVKSGKAPLEKHLKQAENQRMEEQQAEADKKAGKNKPKKSTSVEIAEDTTVKSKSKPKRGEPAMLDRESRQVKRKRQGSGVSALPPGKKGASVLMDDGGNASTRIKHLVRTGQNTAAPRKNKIVITLPITVRSFSEELGLPAGRVIGKLLQLGTPMVITSPLDADMAELLASEFSLDVEIRQPQSLEEKLITAAEEQVDNPEDMKPRPPVITFLGHVDHGKTSLLDKIMGINVCSGEKGGITQHIRAYQISKQGKKITFVDTPGHQAFTEMRARGANCTDIAVLVVAADDGVMPQTEEAISHARAAGVPIVVALNKIDLPGVNIPKVMQELASNDLLPSEWGGDVEVVKCSAMTGEGIDDLLDTLLTVAELHEFKANPKREAMGICLESQLQQDQGAVAKVLVQNGTLKVGDVVVCGSSYGRVKSMTETLQTSKKVQKALPSMPVNLYGLDKAPGAGDKFYVLDGISDAREIAARKAEQEHQKDLLGAASTHVTLENLFDNMSPKVQTLNIILRTDVRGSIEAIRQEIGKLDNPEVQIRILQAMVGGITEADVALADASDAIIFGFNVVPDELARALAEQRGVQIRRYDIIYKMTDDLRAALEGMLKPEEKQTDLGRAVVQRKFVISHVGTIAGCRVLSGSIQRNSRIRLIRDNRIIGDYAVDTLKHEKDDAKEILQGHECGIKLQNYNDIKEGDIFEAYKIEEISRKL